MCPQVSDLSKTDNGLLDKNPSPMLNLQKITCVFGQIDHIWSRGHINTAQSTPVTPADLGISTSYEGLPTVLIMDGNVISKNLKDINLDENWLYEKLKEYGLHLEQILLATLGTNGE